MTRFTDALGRVVTVKDALQHESQVRFDAKVQRLTKDAKGYITRTQTDRVYRPTYVREYEVGASITSPTHTRHTTYDDGARIETQYDWHQTPTELERDGLGRLTRRTRGLGTKIQTDRSVFNDSGQEVLHTDANGHQVEWVYDGAGRKLEETKAFGTIDAATWRHKYDAVGNLLETKGPRAIASSFDVRTTWDGLNRAVRVEDALGHVTFRAFDEAGNLICEKTPLGDPSGTYAHGAVPATLADVNAPACAATHVTKWAYEEEGKLTKVTTALGHETTYVWDASRTRMLAKQDGNLSLTTYAFEARGLRTDEFQHLDAHPRLTSRSNLPQLEPLNLSAHQGTLHWQTTYDDNGNVETQVDPLGQLTTQVHGLRNRIDEVRYSLHTTPRVLPSVDSESFVYDDNGNVEGVTQTKLTSTGLVYETTTREYDVLDRLETETRYDTKVTGYGYDAKGNRTSVTDFQNVATTYTFDAQDRLKTAVTPEGTTTYGYFEDGLAKSTDYFNGLHEGRCYDDAGRLTALVTAHTQVSNACAPPAFVSRQRYTLDDEGNRRMQVEELTAAGGSAPGTPETTEYGYDDESRLVVVKYPDNTAALYQLDAVGNRVGERKAPASMVTALTAAAFLAVSPAALTNDAVAVFNRADWLESVTDARAPAKDATFEWDVAGNLKRQQTAARDRRFCWDVKQTLTRVEDNGIEAGRYDYGADGLRSKRLTSLESVEYVLDGMQVLVEADGSNSAHPAKRRYHYGSNALAVTDISGATRTTKALHLDALGSPTTETTQAGVVAEVRQYDAWGQYRNGTAPGSTDMKLGYTGHQYDVETGLTYARARYYDAEYGRFLSRDSVEGALSSAPSLHRFAYGNFNPLRYRDPRGRAGVSTELEGQAKSFDELSSRIQGKATAAKDPVRKTGLVFLAAVSKDVAIAAEGLGYVWWGFNKLSGGTIARLDKIHDSSGQYQGEYGTLRYVEDVNRETTMFAVRSIAQLGPAKLFPQATPLAQKLLGGATKAGLDAASEQWLNPPGPAAPPAPAPINPLKGTGGASPQVATAGVSGAQIVQAAIALGQVGFDAYAKQGIEEVVLGDPSGQVGYGDSDLSRAVQEKRLLEGDKGGNYGAARLDDGTVIFGRSGDVHSEVELQSKADDAGKKIVDLYSERQPCANQCQELTQDYNTSWTWPWNDPDPATQSSIRKETNEAMRQAIRELFTKDRDE